MSLDDSREARTSAQHQGRTPFQKAPYVSPAQAGTGALGSPTLLLLPLERHSLPMYPSVCGVGTAFTASGNTETCQAVLCATQMLTRALGTASKITYYQKCETQTVGREVELLSCTNSL